jgi:hypothetical protein
MDVMLVHFLCAGQIHLVSWAHQRVNKYICLGSEVKVSPGQNYDASKIPRGDGHGVTTVEAGAEAIDRLGIFSAAADTPALHKYGNMALSKVGWGGRKAWWEYNRRA